MNKKTRNHFCLLAIVTLLWGCPSRLWAQMKPDAAAEAYIRQVVNSLPSDSSLRRSLEAGRLGSSIHYPWMDAMQQAGVKMSMFEVHGTWRMALGFQPESVDRVVYRRAYDGPNSQITNPTQLKRIRVTGLEEEAAAVVVVGLGGYAFGSLTLAARHTLPTAFLSSSESR